MASNGLSTGYATPVIGVISAGGLGDGDQGRFGGGAGPQFIENFPTTFLADHSIAANPVNGQVFVPIVNVFPTLSGFGVAVFGGPGEGQGDQGGP